MTDQFMQKVAKMRRLQKDYFGKYHDHLTLQACKKAEREVDAELEKVQKKEKQQPKLF